MNLWAIAKVGTLDEYWSHEFGWTDAERIDEHRDIYDDAQKAAAALPMGGEWINLFAGVYPHASH